MRILGLKLSFHSNFTVVISIWSSLVWPGGHIYVNFAYALAVFCFILGDANSVIYLTKRFDVAS